MSLFSGYEGRREKLRKRAPPGPVREYLSHPWPDRQMDALVSPMTALDLETSGLDPKHDDIVSMGWARIHDGRLSLDSAMQLLVQPRGVLPASAVVIHGIGDDRAAGGRTLRSALEELLSVLAGRVVVGHHIRMDLSFLAVACRNLGWGEIAFPCVDTLILLESASRRRQLSVPPGGLTLSGVRKRYSLPVYPAHDALWDAIAAGELWLALVAEMAGESGQVRLADVVETWR